MILFLQTALERLRAGDDTGAWEMLKPALAGLTDADSAELAQQITDFVRNYQGDADPVVQELFCAHVDKATKRYAEASEAMERALRWSALRKKAEEDGLDFNDLSALYRYLGATDFQEYSEGKSRSNGAKLLLDENTVAYLVMAQQMEKLLPVLEHYPGASWLTVGDGRHAFEARFLQHHGAKVLPTNLDPTLLAEAKRLGYIEDYACENLESLSFADASFDFVCCKDTLHHLLRPYLGLYEMMRVARNGIFLIEPFDHSFTGSAMCQTRAENPYHEFEEEAGNYVYSFSERELEKLCVSHGWCCLAVRGINIMQGDNIDNASTDPRDLRLQRARVERSENIAATQRGGWINQGSLLLKNAPSDALRQSLIEAGFAVVDLPYNPHTRRAVFFSLEKKYREIR